MEPVMKDSGERQQFEGGAQRDSATGKPPYSLLPPHMWPMLHGLWGGHVRDFLLTGQIVHLYRLEDDLLQDVGATRLAEWLRLGSIKYDPWNWARGMNCSRVLDSMGRHMEKSWNETHRGYENDVEDHGAATFCNVAFLVHYLTEIDAGRLDPKWNDLFRFQLYNKEESTCPTN